MHAYDPRVETIEEDQIDEGMSVVVLLVRLGFTSSRSLARRLISQGLVSVGKVPVVDLAATVRAEDFAGGDLIIRAGKSERRLRLSCQIPPAH